MGIKRSLKRNFEEDYLTLFDTFQEFIEDKKLKNLAPITLHDYEASFQLLMNHFNYDLTTPLHIMTSDLMRKWTAYMLSTKISPNSINRYLRDWRVFLNWCYLKNYIYNKIDIQMLKCQDTGVKAFSDDDLKAIIKKPTNINNFTEWRTWTIINWVLGTGNRCSTVCNLRVGDIDFKNKEILLRHTKNKKAQIIPLSSALATVVKDYIKTWRDGADAEDYLFPNTANEQLSAGGLTQAFGKYCKERGSTHTNIHGLRHSFALNWVRNKGSEFKLQRILGHSTLDMTRRYVMLATEDLKDDFDDYSALDNLKTSKKPRKLIDRI